MRLLGTKTGLYASEVVLGAASFGTRRGHGSSPAEANAILTAYTDAGGNFIDTSDRYHYGESEEIIGKFLSNQRNNFVICTKYAQTGERNPTLSNTGNQRKSMRQAVESSLKRLKTDYIDIFMPHYDDGVTPLEEISRGLEDLVRTGKILYTGLTNFPAWKIAAIATEIPLSAVQFEYNLLQRTAEREFFPLAQHFGLATMMYSPLTGGLLTGKYRKGETGRITASNSQEYKEDEKTKQLLDTLLILSKEMGSTPGQIAFAWVKAKGGFPILGARTIEQFNEGIKGNLVHLTAEQISMLDQLTTISLGYPHDLLNIVRT